MTSARACCSVVTVGLATSLLGCATSAPRKLSYTVAVEVIDVGNTDAGAPSGTDLAQLAGSAQCAAWVRDPTNPGGVDVIVKLLIARQPDQQLIRSLKALPDVRGVTVTEGATYTRAPKAANESVAPFRVACGTRPI